MEISDSLPIKQNDDGTLSVDARSLHKALEVGKDFSTWIKDRIEKYGFVDGKDFSISESPNLGIGNSGHTGGKPTKDYELTISMAKEIAMVENNEAGRRIRIHLIKIEEAWNQEDLVMARGLQLAFRKLQEVKKLIIENELKIAELTPKAKFADHVAEAETLYSFRDTCKILALNIGEKRLFDFCRKHGILMHGNKPYQEFVDRGLMKVVLVPFEKPTGEKQTNSKPVFTGKGLKWIDSLLRDNGYFSQMEGEAA